MPNNWYNLFSNMHCFLLPHNRHHIQTFIFPTTRDTNAEES